MTAKGVLCKATDLVNEVALSLGEAHCESRRKVVEVKGNLSWALGKVREQNPALWRLLRIICDNVLSTPARIVGSLVVRLVEASAKAFQRFLCGNAATVAYWAYWCATKLRVLQFILLGTQWGKDLQSAYPMFAVHHYWVYRITHARPGVNILFLGVLMASILVSRLDFMMRFIFSFVHGYETVALGKIDERGEAITTTQPVLYSIVGYMDASDSQGTAPPAAGTAPLDLPQGGDAVDALVLAASGAHKSLKPEHLIKLLVEPAWLSYEEPVTIAAVAQRWCASIKHRVPDINDCEVTVLDFISAFYGDPMMKGEDVLFPLPPKCGERPLDTQCFVLTVGDAVIVAFRGSQPLNIFDWFYDFTINSLHGDGNDKEAKEKKEKKEKKDKKGKKGKKDIIGSRAQIGGKSYRLHEGFASNLGLKLQDSSDDKVFSMCYECIYHSITARLLQPAPGGGTGGADADDVPAEWGASRACNVVTLATEKELPFSPWLDLGACAKPDQEYTAGDLLEHFPDLVRYRNTPFTKLKEVVDKARAKGCGGLRELYITGHSLGGAMATVFGLSYAEALVAGQKDPVPGHEADACKGVHVVTYGQPLVGDKGLKDRMQELLPGRYIRVVNDNDIVGRVPYSFLDDGKPMAHGGDAWHINTDRKLVNTKENPPMDRLLHSSITKLQRAWADLRATSVPADVQSSLRFLVRLAMTPIMVLNDHIDYKFVLRNPLKGRSPATSDCGAGMPPTPPE